MTRYAAGRLVESLLVVALMSFVVYGLMAAMPGDPIDVMVQSDPHLTPQDAARLKALYGLDKPLPERYGNWLAAAVRGDFGYSRIHNRPVLEILAPRLWNTLALMGLTLLVSLALAIPIGVASALKPYSPADYAVNFVALAGISVPAFWLALLLIMLFAVELGWLPAGGMGGLDTGDGAPTLWERARYIVLPVAALSAATVGGLTRFVRAATMEALRQDYVRTARAKGAGRWRVVFRHALRNAMIPVTTVLALGFGTLFSGALITETMFGWLGMGKLIYDSIIGNDYNMALVSLLFATALVLFGNLLADLCYAWLDPRVSYR